MVADHDSIAGSTNLRKVIPPEWMPRHVAVALIVELFGANPAIVEQAVTLAAIEGVIPIKPDFDAYRADQAEHIFKIGTHDDLSLYEFGLGEMDWAAFTGRVYHHGTVRSMVMHVLLARAAVLTWARTSPLVLLAAAPAPVKDFHSSSLLPLIPPAPSPAAPHGARLATARGWMTTKVTEPKLWKRESAIQACRAETGATWREAANAWNTLPSELRRTRGRPKK